MLPDIFDTLWPESLAQRLLGLLNVFHWLHHRLYNPNLGYAIFQRR